MPAKNRIPVGLVTVAFLISISPAMGRAQSRPRLRAPKAVLDLLDPADRQCVMQNGGLNKAVTTRPIHLAADRSQQILIRGSGVCLCGAQNCYFWIYRKTRGKYELLLNGTGATKVIAGRASALGYRDVISESHASANETIIRTYRYDGAGYELHNCVNRAYYNDNGEYTKKPTLRPCEVEQKSPVITLPSSILDLELTTLNNKTLKLSDYSDRTIVVNLFAAWCGPCRENLWALIELKRKYRAHPIEMISVVMDSKNHDEDSEEIRRIAGKSINFPMVWDREEFGASMMANDRPVLPQTFVIDRTGAVRKRFAGFNPRMTPQLLRTAISENSGPAAKSP